jgi:hypothetical protein
VAKKARRKLEEEDEVHTFQFPPFDETAFLAHEFEQSRATGIAFGIALGLGAISYLIDRANLGGFLIVLPVVVGLGVIAFSPYLFQRLRPNTAPEYTRGDWASLLLMQIFGWLGFWFLLLNAFPPP